MTIYTLGEREEMEEQERRERIATAALQGLLASNSEEAYFSAKNAAKEAVKAADALIKELDREQE